MHTFQSLEEEDGTIVRCLSIRKWEMSCRRQIDWILMGREAEETLELKGGTVEG